MVKPAPVQPAAPSNPTSVSVIRLNDQVTKDLWLIDENGKSLVEVKLEFHFAINGLVEWHFIALNANKNIWMITASKLLQADRTAVSKESENFLIDTLKLTKNADNTFNKTDTDAITVWINKSEIKPTVSKTADCSNYKVTGGTFKLQFVKDIKGLGDIGVKIGDNYTIDLKGNSIHSIISFFINYKFHIYKISGWNY